MSKKRKRKNEPHDLESNDTFSALSDEPTIEIPNGEMISEREWKRRFDTEWYYGTRYGHQDILQTDEQRAEAERNNNYNKREALVAASNKDELQQLSRSEDEFMQEASDVWEWQNVYKVSGFEDAQHVIYEQAVRDIEANVIDHRLTLTRFYLKMTKLKTLKRREYKR